MLQLYLRSCDNIFLYVHTGGFGGNIGHDPHLLYTLSAVQILALFDRISVLDIDKVSNCILLHLVSPPRPSALFLSVVILFFKD